MRKLLPLLGLLLCAIPASAQTYVQDAASAGASDPGLATFGAGVGSGHFVIALCRIGAASLTPTFGDNGSPNSSWNTAHAVWNDAGNSIGLQLFYAMNVTGAPTTTTCTNTPTLNLLIAGEFSGVALTSALDQAASGATFTSASTVTTQTVTTTSANEVIVACFTTVGGAPSSPSVVAGSGGATWHLFTHADIRDVCAYALVTSTGTHSANFSWTGANPGDSIIASFKAPTASGGGGFGGKGGIGGKGGFGFVARRKQCELCF